jgi:hypothetical protein
MKIITEMKRELKSNLEDKDRGTLINHWLLPNFYIFKFVFLYLQMSVCFVDTYSVASLHSSLYN